jgi:hypothetical protein
MKYLSPSRKSMLLLKGSLSTLSVIQAFPFAMLSQVKTRKDTRLAVGGLLVVGGG